MRLLITSSLCLLLSVGCMSTGKTKFGATYNSEVQSDGAEKVSVDIKLDGRAGDISEQLAQAALTTRDAYGNERIMTFGSNQANDATRRAEIEERKIDKVGEMVLSGVALGGKVADLAAPIISQGQQIKGANEALKIQTKADFRSQFLQAFPEFLQILQSLPTTSPVAPPAPRVAQPAPVVVEQPAVTPVVPDPVVDAEPPVIPPLAPGN